MKPEFVIIHNTANDASANNEIAYMHKNNNKVSFHYAVDDKEIVQGIDLNRNTWNAGDGTNGKGNRKGIAIEICYSKSGGAKFEQAQKNAAELTAKILKEKGWGIDKVTKHQDYNGKNCPHRTLSDYGWQYFLNLVNGYLNPAPKKKTYSKGVAIKFSGKPLYKDSTTKKVSKKLDGTYYIYDGVKTNGRYRITNKANRCGKKPIWMYVTGWVEL